MIDKDLFAAQVQRHLTFVLLYGFLALILLLIFAAFYSSITGKPPDKDIMTLVGTLATSLLALVSGAVGFWIARHRPEPDGANGNSPVANSAASANPTPPPAPPAGANQ